MLIWNFHLKLRSKHGANLKLRFKHGEKNSNLSTARRMPIQALRSKHTPMKLWSKHADLPQAPIHSLWLRWCVRVWVCLVLWCLWLILLLIFNFCGWFLILSVGVCVSEEEANDEGNGFADGKEIEKKKKKQQN